ncbi:MAG: 4Fe-4S binding protein [Muribaculaceae bacterium]|nr:4Fe-4S binding protein [Muribaculaceae bacterium]
MKGLRTIRIVLSLVFLVTSVAFLVFGHYASPLARLSEKLQIIPSILATTMGVTIVWIVISIFLGRIYCSTVCPIGTLQDVVLKFRRKIPRFNRPFSYQPPRQVRCHILLIYLVCLGVGVVAVPYWIEPWNIMRNISSVFNPDAVETTWITLGIGAAAGMAAGIVSAILLVICALFTGRGFCTVVCPIGTALGALHGVTLYHIEIDPDKCINCMKCEEVCKSQCVKVAGRVVDNSRCVRCFDCLNVCPNDAIRFQSGRNRRATPLFRKQVTR